MGKLSHASVGRFLTRADWEQSLVHLIGGVANQNIVRPATFVIACSNAPDPLKYQADYALLSGEDVVPLIYGAYMDNYLDVKVGQGTADWKTKLVIPRDNITLRASGIYSTIFWVPDGTGLADDCIYANDKVWLTFKDFQINARATVLDPGQISGLGINIVGTARSTFKNLLIQKSAGDALKIYRGTVYTNNYELDLYNIILLTSNRGFYGDYIFNSTILGLRCESNTLQGALFEHAKQGNVLLCPWIESNGNKGLQLRYCEDFTVLGGLVSNSILDQISIENTSKLIRLQGMDLRPPASEKYHISIAAGCEDVIVDGNDFEGTAAISDLGTRTRFLNNRGYVTEAKGVAENVTLDDSGVGAIPHTCHIAPGYADAHCKSANLNVCVTGTDATNINILVKDLDGNVVTADTHDFYWKAE